jgi:predicted nucleotidyltransferase
VFKIKTARDLSLKEIQRYQKFYKEQEKKKKEKLQQRYYQAWSIARKAANILHQEYKAQKVVIFGSLRNNEHFSEWSDIDIAVWGIKPELYYKAVARIISLSPIFKIDVVDPEDCQESLKEIIEKEGIVL